jgi:hypothetical protein
MSLVVSSDAAAQFVLVQKLQEKLRLDGRVLAAWLEGSLGRVSDADRYSDIDLHLLVDSEDKEGFLQGFEALLSSIQPILIYRPLPYDPMVAMVLFDNLLQLELWVETEAKPLEESKTQLLLDLGNNLSFVPPIFADAAEVNRELEQRLKDFWFGISQLPKLGRGEHIFLVHHLSHMAEFFCDVVMFGQGKLRGVGMSRVNLYLEPAIQQQLESVLALPKISPPTLARAFYSLIQMMQFHGRKAAEQRGIAYPEYLEATVLRRVHQELLELGISTEV